MPIVHPLPDPFSMEEAFLKLAGLPGRLWFDSASAGPMVPTSIREGVAIGGRDSRSIPREPIGRYSFLTADPIDRIVARIGDPDPWPKLVAWESALPRNAIAGLPPFQGGIAGLWGYESAQWLEATGPLAEDDLPTPALSVGAYDWVIAKDHVTNQAWLISQGFRTSDWKADADFAASRRDAVLRTLHASTEPPDADFGDHHAEPRTRGSIAGPRTSDTIAEPRTRGTIAGPRTSDTIGGTGRPAPDRRLPQSPDATLDPMSLHPTSREGIFSNFSSAGLRQAIDEVIERIRSGDSFQVNLAQRLLRPWGGSSQRLYLELRQTNPAPFAGYYAGEGFEVLSSSPEGFLRVRDGWVETRPIKGTAPRTGDAVADREGAKRLQSSDKERAENVMIVDLMRNDLSRVCHDDSIEVTQLCEVEGYAYVQHLVSAVRGRLREGVGSVELLAACFPGGSVTGAPKVEAMRTIAELEPSRRGPYCGSLGYVSVGGKSEFNILIRTVTIQGGYLQLPVGGGITARSESLREEQETWVKAEGMLRAIRSGIMTP
jgi:para-aminobenzoate synthetase component 1